MGSNTCIVLEGRVTKYRSGGREYAKISIRNSRRLLDLAGREVIVIVISNNQQGVGGQ
jgi:hypothetical protein